MFSLEHCTKTLAVVLLSLYTMVARAETLIVATDVWEDYSNEDGTGYYLDLLKAIYEPKGINIDVKYVPYKRSVEMVDNKKADMMLGAYEGEEIVGVYGKYPIELDVVDAAVSPELAKESLSGKKVGAVRGNEFNSYTNVSMKYREVSNLRSLLKMLNHQRIDAVLDYEVDIRSAGKAIGEASRFEIKTGVLSNPSYFVFANSARGEKMRKIFDEEFIKLYRDGKVQNIYLANTGNSAGLPIVN